MTKEKRKKEAVDIENRNRHLIQLEVPTIIGPIPGSTRSFYVGACLVGFLISLSFSTLFDRKYIHHWP
jgi:hypothetical protein